MNLSTYINIADAMSQLRKQGYTHTFSLEDKGLYCLQTQHTYLPSELRIAEYHRFAEREGSLEKRIVFAIQCEDGVKGLILSSAVKNEYYRLLEMMDKVKIVKMSSSMR